MCDNWEATGFFVVCGCCWFGWLVVFFLGYAVRMLNDEVICFVMRRKFSH